MENSFNWKDKKKAELQEKFIQNTSSLEAYFFAF